MTILENWNAQALDRYRKSLDAGRHDHDCEQRERYGLCDCRKRKRISEGRTGTPPTLTYMYPQCDGCFEEVEHDGDSWVCGRCHVRWDTSDYDNPGEWTDENGPHDASTFEKYGERMIVLATRGSDA